jgi:hypothetical protein
MLFKFARDECLAGNYLIFPDHIKICFLAKNEEFVAAWPFDQALEHAIVRLRNILTQDLPEAESPVEGEVRRGTGMARLSPSS